jgi:hypothetical protein
MSNQSQKFFVPPVVVAPRGARWAGLIAASILEAVRWIVQSGRRAFAVAPASSSRLQHDGR